MRDRAARAAVLALVIASCSGADAKREAGASASAKPAAKSAAAARGWPGKVVPRAATPMHAPPRYLRLKDWTSSGSWTKLVELAKDGERVEAGAEIARFEFKNEEALEWVERESATAKAKRAEQRAALEQDGRKRDAAKSRAELDRELAELDVRKEGLVSNRELELLRLQSRRAGAELEAASRLAGATGATSAASLASIDATVKDWDSYVARYAMYEKASHVTAPHAGIVRHGYLGWARRKVQKPDDMPAGMAFAFVARDERLAIEFYVPEYKLGDLAPGKVVQVRLPDDERRVPAKVVSVEPFPQEMGFLRGDDELPDAQEKAFAVLAELEGTPARFSSGIEVRVEP